MESCPLCLAVQSHLYHRDARRDYLQCGLCGLVFVPTDQRPTPADEKAQYDLHENHPDDPHYRRFLARLAEPLATRLTPGAKGLDFGCGPGPALVAMLREQGFTMAAFDPLYANDRQLLAGHYDFITATEVIEHLHAPRLELARLWSLLEPNGWLGLMTKLVIDARAFAGWHYILDPTHVAFYSRQTFEWIGAWLGARVDVIGADVILLQKPAA